jgi:hypothetical protein
MAEKKLARYCNTILFTHSEEERPSTRVTSTHMDGKRDPGAIRTRQLLRYCHVSASYYISTPPLGNVAENERGCLSRA